ncbi:HIT domain-containing protein [Phlyctema vagabunda]|uniref:Bis(5'-adenosyl)-triphosphatase n=1 Tax=Phlyctema vagabunda TaxID=108571 RepID=A0ABR4P4Y1_9HELO
MILRPLLKTPRAYCQARRLVMTSPSPIHFGPFEVTDQVFYNTPLSYALVNIKPLLPGHVLVIPHRRVQRMTELTQPEVTDLFSTVQRVQRMLAGEYFNGGGQPEDGSFNLAIQDGRDAGQTVPHMHCHIIPRMKDSNVGDEIYERLAGEEGNVGGGLWDAQRPVQAGRFPKIEDEHRKPRSQQEMNEEAKLFREKMDRLDQSL